MISYHLQKISKYTNNTSNFKNNPTYKQFLLYIIFHIILVVLAQFYKLCKMEQLRQLVKQRFLKIYIVLKKNITNEQMRRLKQQEKNRCEKENWILSMIRMNKNISSALKEAYFRQSFVMMKIIDHTFDTTLSTSYQSDETFLNDFIGLYRTFFDRFESKFTFKIKLQNLLRPTNFNVITDLIKYLIDFSRDYYQQIFFWHIKNTRTNTEKIDQNTQQEKHKIVKKKNSIPFYNLNSRYMQTVIDVPFQSINQSTQKKQTILQPITQKLKKTDSQLNNEPMLQPKQKKQQLINKLYDVLELSNVPSIVIIEKDKNNPDVVKLRMNQLYRDMKYRNNICKSTLTNYFNKYQQTQNTKQFDKYGEIIEDPQYFKITYPFRIGILIEKNGFSCITVSIIQPTKKYYSQRSSYLNPLKMSTLATPKASMPESNSQIKSNSVNSTSQYRSHSLQNSNRKQFLLTSLKVLRVSQNFLPPLMLNPQQQILGGSSQPILQNKQALQQKISQKQQSRLQKQQDQGQEKLRYYNMQSISQLTKQRNQKKKLSDLRKHFTTEQKNKRNKRPIQDPQQKLLQWLDRIRFMKDIEKKKILGIKD